MTRNVLEEINLGMQDSIVDRIEKENKKILTRQKYKVKELARKELTGEEFKIYDLIWCCCGTDKLYTWMLTETIADRVNSSVITVRRHLKKIERKWFIFRQYINNFRVPKDDKIINRCRLIVLVLSPEQIKIVANSYVKNKVKLLQKQRANGEISQEEFLNELEKVGFIEDNGVSKFDTHNIG